MHILLIDDSSSTRSLLRTLINSGQQVRHEISEASSGEEALQKVGSGEINVPDLIIVDLNMEGMSGFDLCREFRSQYGNGSEINPYIIIVTANEGVEVINLALDAGANDYMPKPVNVKILHVRLRVAERMLAQAQGGDTGKLKSPTVRVVPTPKVVAPPETNGAEVDPRQALIASAIEATDAPIAVVEAGGDDPTFRIIYTNLAMAETTQFDEEQLVGKSLAELEAWTPEFLDMASSFVGRGAVLSNVPLWSKSRQEFPVYLSFCPIRDGDAPISHYLVVHHL
jgi:DNA-binding response OmpR family regulator